MVADALIYHPAISHYQKFVATTSKYSHTTNICLLISTIYLYQPPSNNHPQSAATSSSAPSNTSPASSPGTPTEPTTRNPPSTSSMA